MTDIKVTLSSGFQVAGKRFGSPTANEKILCLHGWLDSCLSFEPLAYALGQRGYCVVAIDLPGHGLSDRFQGASYHYLNYASTVVRVLNKLGWRKPSSEPNPNRSFDRGNRRRSTDVVTKSSPIHQHQYIPSSKMIIGAPHISSTRKYSEQAGRLHILAHSMGSAIAIMVAGVLAGEVDSLCLLDGFYVSFTEPARYPDAIRAVLEDEDKSQQARRRIYRSIDEAAHARMKHVSSLPGNQSITFESARLCVLRNLKPHSIPQTNFDSKSVKTPKRVTFSPAPVVAPSTPDVESLDKAWLKTNQSSLNSKSSFQASSQPKQSSSSTSAPAVSSEFSESSKSDPGWVFSYDPHVRSGAYRLLTHEGVDALYERANAFTPNITLVIAANGWPMSPAHAKQAQVLSRMKLASVSGSHHVHLDHPDRVLAFVLDCFQSDNPAISNLRSWKSKL